MDGSWAWAMKATAVMSISLILHEWGHYWYAKRKGCRPRITLGIIGPGVGGFFEKLKFTEKFNLHAAGVLTGAIPIIFFNDSFLYLLYVAMSGVDLFIMVILLISLKRYGNRKIIDRMFIISD